ncbi:hypothetical protein C7T96_10220 [Nitratireductor sp. StC3]|nr:hypothetical protein C7T96_10220 [Nitratireductor sp. StC3]
MMVENSTSTPPRRLTFFDATMLGFLLFKMSWKVLAASLVGWWQNGATVSLRVTEQQSASAVIASESLKVTFPGRVVTITVTSQ